MKKLTFRHIDLQLFADGGAGAAASGDGGQTGVTASDAGMQTDVTAPDVEVQSGVKESAAETQKHEEKPADPKAEFAALIGKGGKYKAEFDQAMNTIVRGRLSEANRMAERYAPFEPIVQALAKQHGVDPSNTEALLKAINGDQESIRRKALENDMSEDAVKLMDQLEQENSRLKARERAAGIERQYNALVEQEKEARAAYENFTLETEMKNPDFKRLTAAGVPLKAAYEVIHMQELVTGAISHAVKTTEKRVADSVAAGAKRPSENGLNASVPASAKVDVAGLSPKQREAYNNYVKRGGKLGITEFMTRL